MRAGRFQYSPPWNYSWWRPFIRHGGDEYGNCSVYFNLPLLGEFVFFYDVHYQTDIELPEPGENAWVDRRYYPACAVAEAGTSEGEAEFAMAEEYWPTLEETEAEDAAAGRIDEAKVAEIRERMRGSRR